MIYLQKISYVDVLASGFPCQSFSLAGNKKGFGDSRGTVFFKICELITFLQEKFSPPKVIFLENVKISETTIMGIRLKQ